MVGAPCAHGAGRTHGRPGRWQQDATVLGMGSSR